MDIFNDDDCIDYSRRFARKAYNQYKEITNCERLTYEDIVNESFVVLLEIRQQAYKLNDPSDCGAFCWVAMKRHFRRVVDNTSIVKMPDYSAKSYDKTIAGYYVAGNELSIDTSVNNEDSSSSYEELIYNNTEDFTTDVVNKLLLNQIRKELSEEDREELERYLQDLTPISRKRRETLVPRCRTILDGKLPYKNHKSKFPGVEKRAENKYRAYVIIDRRKKNLGIFSTPEEAYNEVLRAKEVTQ